MRDVKQLTKLFGQKTADTVDNAKILVVGAGGIGCELLKDLSVSGFKHIKAVDLDTIDLSNLNRQFLFQRRHIKRSKAQVAVQAIQEFNPSLDASFEQANIKQTDFDVDWFSQFDLVFNALDNLDARRHVNSMCLAAHVPLIESGTAGYLGQVTVIKGGETECFDCHPKPAERKTYPVCTIRSTPTAPIHCIVWAKDYLFAQMFGEQAPDEIETSAEGGQDDLEELKQLKEESKELAKLADAMGSSDFTKLIFQKVFDNDITRLLSMKDMWKQRQPPHVLHFDQLEQSTSGAHNLALIDDHLPLSLEQAFVLFQESADKLAQRLVEEGNRRQGAFLAFDKDDEDALHFVAAAANLRSYAFGIEAKSIFTIKAMAGNIIPAIATTNAIVAGMMVLQGILVMSGRLAECHTAYLSYNSKRPRSIIKEGLAEPNPLCSVCRRRYLTLRVANCAQTTLGDIVNYINRLEGTVHDLSLGEEISIVEGSRILYDFDYDDNLQKPLAELGLGPGKMVTLSRDDESSGSNDTVSPLYNQDNEQPSSPLSIEGFELIPKFAPIPKSVKDEASEDPNGNKTSNDNVNAGDTVNDLEETGFAVEQDGAIVIDDEYGKDEPNADANGIQNISNELAKRKLDEIDANNVQSTKRRATEDTKTADSIEIID
ncbi:hypothetical protein BX070DRAFT_239725 [Coemansia spiralis]|nr:hypothetical protein BX070DRAFT_239725 [Coemansia spiralis]